MKLRILCTLFTFSFVGAKAQIINIPDASFKNALVNTNCAVFDEFGQNVGDVDTNDDGEIQMSEAEAVLKLDVSNSNIESLIGVNSFTNLEQLICNNNQLTDLDVSGLDQMQIFECINNQITSLDVSNFVNQSYINCNNNLISDLIVGESNNIVWLQCRNNLLTTLDMNGSSSLEVLLCSNNLLNTLYINNNADETAFGLFNGNPQDSFNFSNNDTLASICADDSEIDIVQSLIDIYGYDCEIDSMCRLSVSDNNLTSTKLYPNPVDNILSIESDAIISEATIYDSNGRSILRTAYEGDLYQLDLSKLRPGIYFLKVLSNTGIETFKIIKK